MRAGALLAAAVLLAAQPAVPMDDLAVSGHRIYTGQTRFSADGSALPAGQLARFSCHNCHGRDSRGGTEGDVPPIEWARLAEPTATRPAYDAVLFERAVLYGRGASGRPLSRLMPRYDLRPIELRALRQYLEQIDEHQRRGVSATEIRVGVPIQDGATKLGVAYRKVLQATVDSRVGEAGVHGRAIRIVPLEGGPAEIIAAASGVLAVAGFPPHPQLTLGTCTSRGVPALCPIAPLAGDEDPSIVRSMMPTRKDMFRALPARSRKRPLPRSLCSAILR